MSLPERTVLKMYEYISREEAIKELREVYENEYPTASGDFDEYASHDVPNVLRNIPAADVEPSVSDVRYVKLAEYEDKEKRGKWRQVSVQTDEFNNHLYECTLCRATDRHNINVNVPYCWHCGAKMMKED